MSTNIVLLHDQVLTFSLTGVMEDQTIHLVKGSVPAPGPSSPSVANAGVGTGGTAQATATSTTQTPGDAQRGLLGSNLDASNPFLGATLDGTGNGNAAIQRMQQQLMSNPDMMVNSLFHFYRNTKCTSRHSYMVIIYILPFEG